MRKMVNIIFIYSIFLVINSLHAFGMQGLSYSEKEQALINKLLKNYSKKQKPSGTVEVKFALNLNQIVNVKAKDQVFMLNVFLDHEWVDNRLSWIPEDNGNISILRISCEYLWTPDTFVYTTADNTGFLLPQTGAYFVVGNDGKIFWPNPLPQMKVRCRMGIEWFPYDDQMCTIVFGSWSHTQRYLNYTLMNEESALAGYVENSEWTLLGYKGFRNEILYDNWIEKDAFSEIHYKILIRRKPLFVLQNYCIPAVMLCVITLCSFFMPFPQEMQLGISVMLTFSILKLKLSDDVPAQSDSIPLFNIYFTGCMVFSLLSIIWFNQMNLFSTRKSVPKYVRVFIIKYVCTIMRKQSYKIVEIVEEVKKPAKVISNDKRIRRFTDHNNRSNCNKSVTPSNKKELDYTAYKKPNFKDFKILESASYFSLKPLETSRAVTSNNSDDYGFVEDGNIEKIKREERIDFTDMEILPILNHFIFYLFVLYIVLLNGLLLIAFPYLVKSPLTID